MILNGSVATGIKNHVERMCSTQMSLYGAACLRIGYGIAGVAYYIINYSDRDYLWGPEGVYPFDAFRDSIIRPTFSIYEFSKSQAIFEGVFHLGLIISLLFCLGVGGRVMTAAHYLFLLSLYTRNPAVLDGGDNLSYIVLLYLIPVNTTSVLALKRRPVKPALLRISTLLHNMGLGFIVVQLCVVYLTSGMYKIQGQLWQDGTALYYILKVPEFSWPVITDTLIQYSWFITLATYGAVLFQIFFPALIIRQDTRVVAVICGIGFHLSIALLMGLTTFSLYMMSTEAVLLSDNHYRKVKLRIQSFIRHLSFRDVIRKPF